MGRFIDCQLAIAPWGSKAKFRRARVGLMRRDSTVYLAVFLTQTDQHKFQIDENIMEVLPAAIRLKQMGKDIFLRQVSDEQRYATMLREIKILLKKDKLKQGPKSDVLDKFITSIPRLDAINPRSFMPAPLSAKLTGCDLTGGRSCHGIGPKSLGDAGDDIEILNESSIAPHSNGKSQASLSVTTNDRTAGRSSQGHRQLENKKLRSIQITGLESIPKELWLRTSLHELILIDCNLTQIPKQLETFADSLVRLDLSLNSIDVVPRTFCCKMSRLVLLNLSHNRIQTLPIEIKFFRKLVDLNISHNHLRMLPSTFTDLRNLRNLNVANNNLSQLPAFRKEDIRLKYLDVSQNPLDGALYEANTFEVHSSLDGYLGYNENLLSPLTPRSKITFPSLFEISMLRIVRCDKLLKLASEESLPQTIVSTMQRDIFKCYKCNLMSILPAYNSTDILDYVEQVEVLNSTGNYRHGMTFMKLLCRSCFDKMSS